jgi:hypothetical protein
MGSNETLTISAVRRLQRSPACVPELKLYLPNTLVFCSFVMLFMVHAALLRMVTAP